MDNRAYALGGTRISIGLSAIIRVSPGQGTAGQLLQIVSGGSLEIVPPPVALTGTSAAGWGLGYLLGGTERLSIAGPACYYLAATGTAVVLSVAVTYTQGVPGITLVTV